MSVPSEKAVTLADDAVRYAALSRVIDAIATGPLAPGSSHGDGLGGNGGQSGGEARRGA